VKRLIRNKKTQQYLKQGGSWANHPEEAVSFRDVGSVLQAVHAYKLADVEMISLIREEPSRLGVVIDL